MNGILTQAVSKVPEFLEVISGEPGKVQGQGDYLPLRIFVRFYAVQGPPTSHKLRKSYLY
jgi:hypothetical protein